MNYESLVEQYFAREGFVDRTVEESQDFIVKVKGEGYDAKLEHLLGTRRFPGGDPRTYWEIVAQEKINGLPLWDVLSQPFYRNHQWRLDQTARILDSFGAENLLEVGCGTGLDAAFLGKYVSGIKRFYATDVCPDMVLVGAERKLRNLPSTVNFGVASAHDLPFGRDFDCVIAYNCLSETESGEIDRDSFPKKLQEMCKVIKPSGRIIVSATYSDSRHELPVGRLIKKGLDRTCFKIDKLYAQEFLRADGDTGTTIAIAQKN